MAWAAVAGQNAQGQANGATSFTVTLPANATVNNRVVLEFTSSGNAFTPSTGVSGLGATWVKNTSTTGANGGFNDENDIWSVVVGSAGTTITCTISGGAAVNTFGSACAQEYSGTLTANAASDMDVGSSSTGTSGTPSTTTAATTAANELVAGGYGDDGSNVTLSGGAGFTVRQNQSPNTVSESLEEDEDSGASGGTQTANLGNTVAQRWFMSCAVYKITGGAAPAPINPPMRTLRGVGI